MLNQPRLTSWRKRSQEEQDAQAFPDEIDTPQDISAHTRFARFRGLRSLRTSPWDPYENLPSDYARIFEFEDFKRTERDMWHELEDNGIEVGNPPLITVQVIAKNITAARKARNNLY